MTHQIRRCEDLIYLFYERITLHVTPCETSSFKGNFQQVQITNDVIENHDAMHITSIYLFLSVTDL